MIKSFEIDNFRCFEKTKVSGFGRVNLIGGKNNSGKTALLEALYLNNSPMVYSINFLRRLRAESLDVLKELPERAWDNFFFNQVRNNKIYLVSENDDESRNIVVLSCNDTIEEFSQIIAEKAQRDEEFLDLMTLPSSRGSAKSILYLSQIIDGEADDFDDAPVSSMIAHSEGIAVKELDILPANKVDFIPASVRLSSSALAREYDKADLNNRVGPVLKAIQMIDDSIEQVRTFNLGKPALYLKRANQDFLPLSLFGEAINRVADFILRLANNQGSILLIDEIENGIHYTSHHELWRMIFKLSVEFEAQIFATTHSWEMIQAFADVGLEEGNEGVGAYFELARNVRTNRITGIKHDLETLDYAIKRKMGVRGEQRFNRREQK